MSILFAGLLLGVFGMLVWAAPKRKRYRRNRRWTPVGDDSIDGEENDDVASAVDALGVFDSDGRPHESTHGTHHVGGHDVGHHGGHDFGGHDFGGGHGGGDFGGHGGGDFGGGHH